MNTSTEWAARRRGSKAALSAKSTRRGRRAKALEPCDDRRTSKVPPRPKPALLGQGPRLEPAVLAFRREFLHTRASVIQELQTMVDETEDETTAWLESLPQHVRATYTTSDRPRPFQGSAHSAIRRPTP